MKLTDTIIENRIKKQVSKTVLPENIDYIEQTINYLDDELNYLDSIIGQAEVELREYIKTFSRLAALQYDYNENILKFYTLIPEQFEINYKDGVFVIPKEKSTNRIYLQIIKNDEELLNKIADLYKKLKPYLLHRAKLNTAKDIVSGKTLYDAYYQEYKNSKENKIDVKLIQKDINYVKGELFDNTGWYYMQNMMFGTEDVDHNIINAIKLTDRWEPYSQDEKKKEKELNFISDNKELLEQYRIDNKKIQKIAEQQTKLEQFIAGQIEKRNAIISKVKGKKNHELRKQMSK